MHKDIMTEIGAYILNQLYKDVFVPVVNKCLPLYVKMVEESGSGFIASSRLTCVIVLLSEFSTTVKIMHPEEIAKHLELDNYIQRLHSANHQTICGATQTKYYLNFFVRR
uniref:Uncharacterized protein n=1 Tax=Ditylenchus dipsaci TaxID=166011 RepID=A0A915DU88_9BILA